MKQLAIQAENIVRTLKLEGNAIHILNGVSFGIEKRQWVALMGPSGSGKSTLLGILAGLDSPTDGRIELDGVDITTMNEGRLAQIRNGKIGIVFQSFNLIPTLTALENVETPLYVSKTRGDSKEKAKKMLELVGLGERLHHRPSQLSGGQQQRVAIARALVTEPAILVADEPTGNLDSATGHQILALFEELRQKLGVTLVIATHDEEVAKRADRTLHLVDGKLDG